VSGEPSHESVRGELAGRLERELPDGPERHRRAHDLYLPILFWLSQAVRQARPRPLLAGLSAPQGAGKSTIVRYLVPLLGDLGIRAVAVSIDDFYLTHTDQAALAAANPDNPYLQYRGYPGTHDVALGTLVLSQLQGLRQGGEVRVPVYDKSAHGGRGDRLPARDWRSVSGPLDLVLVEGWMLGFNPLEDSQVVDASLRAVNAKLGGYEPWVAGIDAMVILRASDPRHVLRWRVEAEEAMKASGKPGLDRAAIEDYVRRFLPAYELYASTVQRGRWAPDRQLVFTLGEDRLPILQS
jgi:D-glycerate 3-kinase